MLRCYPLKVEITENLVLLKHSGLETVEIWLELNRLKHG